MTKDELFKKIAIELYLSDLLNVTSADDLKIVVNPVEKVIENNFDDYTTIPR